MSQKDNESTQTIENLKHMQLFCQDFSKKWKEIEQQGRPNGRSRRNVVS
jgi:hypothetical protein